ncbi:EAL domain-containing protein [Sulfuricurvum sp.]|uniref:EAL domain-containing protein n=1 Tax=Sulfuricurvum sp. TaxID=2025608 RepID=UPI00261EB6FD|nr:EAL domain-containing protein [Sulfuricurvum sp.]MDD2266984.1 EAL domain-containing protein [Sulfuricurvum sp.]MDD2784073.1 EAL domain-containing protein [Sulfuricurvum sp.]
MSHFLNISLLYVEDEEGIRNSVARTLSMITDKIATAENGVQALEYLKSHTVDLIITDIRMPEMDGLSFIEKLRLKGIDTPVIITSAFNEIEFLNKAIDLKVEKFINKPIRVTDLIEVISRIAEIIENKRQLRIRIQELEHYRQAIDQTNFVIRITNDGTIIDINKDLKNYFNNHCCIKHPLLTIKDFFTSEVSEEILKYCNDYKVLSKTVSLTMDNERYTVLFTAFASRLEENSIQEISIMISDITPVVKEKEETINRLYTDPLTGLPNRIKLFEELAKNESTMALLLIDIENFSNINHLYGFEAGDEILLHMAHILKDYWPDQRPRTLYRTDTDHFVILTEKMANFERDTAEDLALKLIKRIENENFVIAKTLSINIGVTMAASCIGEHDLFSEASMALTVAKSRKVPFMCFADLNGIREMFKSNLIMQNKIKTALSEDLIVNYYQPIVDSSGSLVKYEALVRMIDPEEPNNIFTPFHFLDIARQSKNYPLLTRKVMTNAFRDFGESSIDFSINLSFDDIANPETTTCLEELFQRYPKANVTLEILESEGLKDIDETLRFFNYMKGFGAKIAIDDFGSGYSNFAYFFDMPLDILKIDGSVVKRIHEYRGYLALETIVKFANNLGVKTVAEFVEDATIFDKLKTLGVDMFQGYYFAQPKPFEAL